MRGAGCDAARGSGFQQGMAKLVESGVEEFPRAARAPGKFREVFYYAFMVYPRGIEVKFARSLSLPAYLAHRHGGVSRTVTHACAMSLAPPQAYSFWCLTGVTFHLIVALPGPFWRWAYATKRE